jgi:type IV pilus assembly protein PilV
MIPEETNSKLHSQPRSRVQAFGQSGFGLLEALIAVVLISVGVIGAVSMSASAIRQSALANQQALAATLVQQIIERMRANLIAVHDGHYDTAVVDCNTPPQVCEFTTPYSGGPSERCTTTQMAAFDVYAVTCSSEFQQLPQASMAIECLPVGGACTEDSMHRVSIGWSIHPQGTINSHQVVMTFYPG